MAEAQAVRLVFEYDGDQVRLVLQQPVDVVVATPGPAPVAPSAMAVETRSADGDVLDRVGVAVPLLHSAEVFPEDPAGRIERVDVASGAFTVVVPVTEAARAVAVVRGRSAPPPPPGGPPTVDRPGAAAPEVLATFDLEGTR